MPERPVNNLPPGSQPWAREIAGAIDAAQFDAIKANMNNKNAFKTINATLDQLAKQQAQILEQQEELAQQQIVLQELLSNQVTASVNSVSSGSLSSGTTGDLAISTFTRPSGYTRALVLTVVSGSVVAGTGRIFVGATIGDKSGGTITCNSTTTTGNGFSNSYARYYESVPASFITCAYVTSSTIGYSVTNNTIVIFLK